MNVLDNMPRLEFQDQGRSGHLIAFFGNFQIKGYYEFCGGDALVSILIPDKENWIRTTGISADRREDLLHLLAKQIQKEKFIDINVFYRISDQYITFYI